MLTSPWSQPSITCRDPSVNVNGSRPVDVSNCSPLLSVFDGSYSQPVLLTVIYLPTAVTAPEPTTTSVCVSELTPPGVVGVSPHAAAAARMTTDNTSREIAEGTN